MKIQLVSDLHRELYSQFFGRSPGLGEFPWAPAEDADVIVVAGDFDHGVEGVEGVEFLCAEAERIGKPILYVAGNHEFYNRAVYQDCIERMRELAVRSKLLHFLDCEEIVIDGVRFLGATLWTDFKASISTAIPDVNLAMFYVGRVINDYAEIGIRESAEGTVRGLKPIDVAGFNAQARAWLEAKLAEPFDGKTVVVTHHGPSPDCQSDRHGGGGLAGAYWSDLRYLFADVDLWMYGHTHTPIDKIVEGDMRLVSNPGGYPHENIGGFDPQKIVEV